MKYLRNIKPHEVIKITDMINHSGKSIASKALIDNDHTEIRFFSFPKGESISKEYYEMETLFVMLEGKMCIRDRFITASTYFFLISECSLPVIRL